MMKAILLEVKVSLQITELPFISNTRKGFTNLFMRFTHK